MSEFSADQFLIEIENILEDNFDQNEFEEKVYSGCRQIENIWDILRLGSLVRWADFQEEFKGEEIALNVVERAIEISVKSNNIDDLEIIASELENSMELDERASEVREIISNIEGSSKKK
jgi:hypothetical protein